MHLRVLWNNYHPTSLMTWQNRMALDMLLAEKGSVCVIFGDIQCAVYSLQII